MGVCWLAFSILKGKPFFSQTFYPPHIHVIFCSNWIILQCQISTQGPNYEWVYWRSRFLGLCNEEWFPGVHTNPVGMIAHPLLSPLSLCCPLYNPNAQQEVVGNKVWQEKRIFKGHFHNKTINNCLGGQVGERLLWRKGVNLLRSSLLLLRFKRVWIFRTAFHVVIHSQY